MSVLLVAPPVEVGPAIVARLVSQGDEVRVVVERDGGPWRDLGAHVAVGDPTDDDLIMRAGQHCRTIVLFGSDPERLAPALDGAAAARIDRGVFVVPGAAALPDRVIGRLAGYVVLGEGRPRWRRRRVAAADLARAVDAADDLGGDVALRLDLSEASAWRALGIDEA